jgi:hypothetical protein
MTCPARSTPSLRTGCADRWHREGQAVARLQARLPGSPAAKSAVIAGTTSSAPPRPTTCTPRRGRRIDGDGSAPRQIRARPLRDSASARAADAFSDSSSPLARGGRAHRVRRRVHRPGVPARVTEVGMTTVMRRTVTRRRRSGARSASLSGCRNRHRGRPAPVDYGSARPQGARSGMTPLWRSQIRTRGSWSSDRRTVASRPRGAMSRADLDCAGRVGAGLGVAVGLRAARPGGRPARQCVVGCRR